MAMHQQWHVCPQRWTMCRALKHKQAAGDAAGGSALAARIARAARVRRMWRLETPDALTDYTVASRQIAL